ncbi:GNAT family N-acetyltransferase [Streptomyces sp. MH60]|uniref:GNAT family N-acetyltransferase n=1 Tax=Streptomyces sp. MH60 TaxID=1940758 RepID=UPI00313D7433
MAADPGRAQWMVRQAVVGDRGLVVGHAGFHGPPDEVGMVEIGYSIAPDCRRQGYARSALIELLRRAAAEPTVDDCAGGDKSRQRGTPGHDRGTRLRRQTQLSPFLPPCVRSAASHRAPVSFRTPIGNTRTAGHPLRIECTYNYF